MGGGVIDLDSLSGGQIQKDLQLFLEKTLVPTVAAEFEKILNKSLLHLEEERGPQMDATVIDTHEGDIQEPEEEAHKPELKKSKSQLEQAEAKAQETLAGRAQSKTPMESLVHMKERAKEWWKLQMCEEDEREEDEAKKSESNDKNNASKSTKDEEDHSGPLSRNEEDHSGPTSTKDESRNAKISREVSFVRGQRFAIVSGLLIFATAVFLGYYADRNIKNELARLQDPGRAPYESYGCSILALLFMMELTVRILALRLAFFDASHDFWWNILDIVVAVWLVSSWVAQSFRLTMVTAILFVRSVRVLNLVEMSSFFRVPLFAEFRIVLVLIVRCIPSLLSVLAASFMCLYFFSVPILMNVSYNVPSLDAASSDDGYAVKENFNSMYSTMWSLFMIASGGADWGEARWVFKKLGLFYEYCFLFYIVFALYAITNIATGIFVSRVFHLVDSDFVYRRCAERVEAHDHKNEVKSLFYDMEGSEDLDLSLDEFKKNLQNKNVLMYMKWLGIDSKPEEAEKLFELLDTDGSKGLSLTEFHNGCAGLRRAVTTLDTKDLKQEIENMKKEIREVTCMVKKLPKRRY